MVVISKKKIKEFIEEYSRSRESLLKWYLEIKAADWSNLSDLKQTFPAADYVGNGLVVFNVGGNNLRVIARIIFRTRTVFVREILTHAQYDKVKLSDL